MEHFSIHLKDRYPFLGEEGRSPRLELFLPHDAAQKYRGDDPRPTILLLPGGGYRFTSDREGEPIALHFLAVGYNVCILWYSVSPHHDPVQIVEVAAAMETIQQNAAAWHVDTGKLVLIGFSAGGHLAAYYANRFDCASVRNHFPNSRGVDACVLGYPVITGDPACSHPGCFQELTGSSEPTAEELSAFSCERMVTDRTPPTFLWCTRTDKSVSVMNSLLYAESLAKNGVPFSLHVFPFGGHGLATVDLQTNPPEKLTAGASLAHAWISEAIRWLEYTLA
ncbi:MAG: alpha/beta hydrolase [Oscillospiraceae bacterium]|nr:alpha/beta hydrolase [Oscillospiraceae bacterium]